MASSKDISQAPSQPKRSPKTITMRDDYHDRLRKQAVDQNTAMSFLIEQALEKMWGIESTESGN
ncbi:MULTISPECIES: hypothetical protein [Pseudomonas syringae group]|uniref:hypothetical protein n=1 Tax=Pseudomonas syringae group TaxID=136849 RepID=UPI0001CC2ECC|nr:MULTISPECIES: hypothetical protein [Pseudomonas syringae group]KWT20564.1 hypothetical protein AL043_27755 [Pseudomonas amygdali pv. aesculi]KWT26819.1 hypothetical protein AL042_14265 [Pseudomonas amygdali pv. aesculi]KWT32195.1 hypothetical protein AL044_09900 [Pseudomonas amygdali pv. aesculi]KWT36111.1 hypothetical protein AL045_25410 [Pseudomonas amygdali pv. aesculi]KWT40075.1 hypothetical protein AMC94_00895 [Pseudomonas amygdali pv. aesculi]